MSLDFLGIRFGRKSNAITLYGSHEFKLEVFNEYPNLQTWSDRVRDRDAFQEMKPKVVERFTNMVIG